MESTSYWRCSYVCGQFLLFIKALYCIYAHQTHSSDCLYLVTLRAKQNNQQNLITYFIKEEERVEKHLKQEKSQICRGNQYLFRPHYS
jgi:hypothetical protein